MSRFGVDNTAIKNSLYPGVLVDFPSGSGGKESACNVGDPGFIPRSVRSPGE